MADCARSNSAGEIRSRQRPSSSAQSMKASMPWLARTRLQSIASFSERAVMWAMLISMPGFQHRLQICLPCTTRK
jgi:hypothetical protein